jgi:hypothetical protein
VDVIPIGIVWKAGNFSGSRISGKDRQASGKQATQGYCRKNKSKTMSMAG